MSAGTDAEARSTGQQPTDVVARHKQLVRRTALISGFTAISRVLGFVRESLTAALFGEKSAIFDAFVTAWRVPNLFRRLLGEGAVSTSLQTTMTEADAERGEAAGRGLMWESLRLAFWILLAICALVMGAVTLMGERMPLTGWAWLGVDADAMRELTLQVTPYVVVICLCGLAGGALAVRGKFAAASAGPGVMNLVAIATLVLIGLRFGWQGLEPADGPAGRERHLDMARWFSWGLLLSGFAQLALLVPEMRSARLFGRSGDGRQHRAQAWIVLKTSLPLALGAAVYQINVLIDSFMANNLLPTGGASTYYFANRIQQLPLALVATAATSAVFPAMKALAHTRDFAGLRKLHEQTHLAIAFIALPASFGLFVLAAPVTSVLLERGEFGPEGVARTASAIEMLCLALLPAGALGLLSRVYYALGDFKTPVRVSIVALVLNVVFNAVFVLVFELDTAGLALGTAIVSWLNVLVLVPGALRRMGEASGTRLAGVADFWSRAGKMLFASALCGTVAWLVHRALADSPQSIFALGAAIALGIGVYLAAAQVLRLPEWLAVREKVARRLRR